MKYIKEHIISIDTRPEILINGTKLMSIKFRHVKLIDSYSFIPISLEKFTKTFCLKELKKGFFPHLFNVPANQTYRGNIPDKKYYGSQFFSESKKEEFDNWYENASKSVFDFRAEIDSYCLSDFKLLKEGCSAFRNVILKITDNKVYRHCQFVSLHLQKINHEGEHHKYYSCFRI